MYWAVSVWRLSTWGTGRTLLIASHVPADIAPVDELVMMANGQIIKQGSVTTLIDDLGWCWRASLETTGRGDLREKLGRLGSLHTIEADADGTLIAYGGEGFAREFSAFAVVNSAARFALTRVNVESLLEHGVVA